MASSRLALTDGECNPSAPSKGQFHSPSIPRPVLTYDECNPSALLTVSYLTFPASRLALTYVESCSKCNAPTGILLGKCDLVRYFLTCFTQGILTPGVLTRRVFGCAGHFDARGFDWRREIHPPQMIISTFIRVLERLGSLHFKKVVVGHKKLAF